MPAPGEAVNWIKGQPFFDQLSIAEQQEAGSFSFIWGIYELRVMKVLDKRKTESLSKGSCREYARSEHIPKVDLSAEKSYFRHRFFELDGNSKETWDNAEFRDNDRSEEIREVLLSNDASFEDDAEALLRVVTRLRNNYFHGIKWAYNLKGQLDNFTHANSVLIKTMPTVYQVA
jgi:hypothetical protein